MDEGCENDKGERGERHETSGAAWAKGDLDISASGLLSLGCSRGVSPRSPQRLDQQRLREAARNPSCHSVDSVHLMCRSMALSMSSVGSVQSRLAEPFDRAS